MVAISDMYFARAAECAREAQATNLANVRMRFLRSETAWRAMGDRQLRMENERDRQAIEKAARVKVPANE